MKIFVTGGAGYIGSMLIPELLKSHRVVVYDLFLYGSEIFGSMFERSDQLQLVYGDIRDKEKLLDASKGSDIILHLASISNDPSYELNPEFGKSINYDATYNVLEAARNASRLIFASSASVYGVQDDILVTEGTTPKPITDYSKYKLEAESIFLDAGVNTTVVRCATVCGYAPRLRLDVVVNIFTAHALINKKIKIFGGTQLRPNINIKDVVDAYNMLITAPANKVNDEIFNLGSVNMSLNGIADTVANVIPNIAFEHVTTDDLRSYFINSDKIETVLDFKPKHSIEEAISSLVDAYNSGYIVDGLNNPMYHNVKFMKEWNENTKRN